MPSVRILALVVACLTLPLLSGCMPDIQGAVASGPSIEDQNAMGAACRQVGDSLEACYRENTAAAPKNIYQGWLVMDDYMRSNHIETMQKPDRAPEKSTASLLENGVSEAPSSAGLPDPSDFKANSKNAPSRPRWMPQ